MEILIRMLSIYTGSMQLRRSLLLLVGTICLIFQTTPVYSQFADLPRDVKTVDIGVNGDGASQTLSLTAVVPVRKVNFQQNPQSHLRYPPD